MAICGKSIISKWGNTPAVRIPTRVMREAGLGKGDKVVIEAEQLGVIVVRAARESVTLKSLVAQITPGNRHEIIS